MNAALTAILTLIQQILPLATGTSSSLIATIIQALQSWLPIIFGEIQSLYPIVKNIISELQNKGDLTDDQKTTLQQLDAQTDAAFEAATAGLDPDAATT